MFDTLNAPQQAAVDHTDSPLLIVAGAGTGKTKTLAARVSRILDEGADPNRVLLLTFTRRAAAEMLARVAATGSSRAAAQVWGGTFHSVETQLLQFFKAIKIHSAPVLDRLVNSSAKLRFWIFLDCLGIQGAESTDQTDGTRFLNKFSSLHISFVFWINNKETTSLAGEWKQGES